jgi:hypothetical protein
VVSVDGVNVLSGETATTQQSGYVVTRREKLAIRGWRKSMGEIAAFYFTSLGDSYAARTGRPDNVGVIGVALYRRKAAYVPPIPMATPDREFERKREANKAPSTGTGPARRRRLPARIPRVPAASTPIPPRLSAPATAAARSRRRAT